jgi:hypothetical protein
MQPGELFVRLDPCVLDDLGGRNSGRLQRRSCDDWVVGVLIRPQEQRAKWSFRILIVFSNKNNDLALAHPRSRLHVNFRLPVVGVGECPNQAFRFCDL